MDSSSVSVSVNVLVEVLRSIEKKVDSQQQVLSAIIQQQQHLHHQQLLLQRHSSAQNLQVPAVHAAPSDTTATAAVTTASPATPVVTELPDCPTHKARHSPTPAGSSGQVAGSCCGDAEAAPAASLLHTHKDAEAAPASGGNAQCPAVDTASSKQQNPTQLGVCDPQVQQSKAAGSPRKPAVPIQQQVQAPASPALAGQDRPQPKCTDSSAAACPAMQSSCFKQQLAGQPPRPAAATQLQVQQPQQQGINAAAFAAAGTAGKLPAADCAPLLAEQQQQQQSSASEATQQTAPQQQSAVEQQMPLAPSVPQPQLQPKGHSVLCTGSPLEPTPELLIIPGEGSGSTGTTIYNVDDRQLLCSTPSEQEFGEAPAQQQQQRETHNGPTKSATGAAERVRLSSAAAVTGDSAAEMGTQQGDSAAPYVGGAASLRTRLGGHSSAPQLCRYKPSAFIDQQQQMLQSCSGETADALLSIISCGNKSSTGARGAGAAAAAGTNSQKQRAGATSPSDLLSASSTGGAVAATRSAVLNSLYVGKPDLERFASTESINTLGSHQHQKHVITKQEPEQAAPSSSVQLPHQGSLSSFSMGLDLQPSMSSPAPLPAQQVNSSPAAPKYGQQSPLQPPLHPMAASGARQASASSPQQGAAAGGAATEDLNLPAATCSQGWQAMCSGQLPEMRATAGLTGAASVPMPTLMPQASSALMHAWSVPSPSLAVQSSGSFNGWSTSFLCAGADMAAMQLPVLQQQQSGSFTQQQWQHMSVDAWQQQPTPALQNMPSGSLPQAAGGYCSHAQPGRMQHMSQTGQRAARGAGVSSRNTTAKVAAAAAAAHAAAKVAAAAAAAQHAGAGAGSKRKHVGSAGKASKSQCKSGGTRSGQVPAQKQNNYSFTSVSSGMPQAGPKMQRSLSASALPLPQQQQPIAADPGALTQFPNWLLQQAYNTFMPMSRTSSTASAQQQQEVNITGRDKNAVAAAPAATAAPTVPAVGPAPAAVQPAAAPPPAPPVAAAGSGSTDTFFVDDTAAYFNNDQDTAAAASVTCASLPPLAPTMEAAAAAAGVSLQTASAALDNVDTANVGAVAAGGDGLGATVYIPTGGFMQMLQDPLF